MKKKAARSHSASVSRVIDQPDTPESELSLDTMTVNILSLETDDDSKYYHIRVAFFDQLILNTMIVAIDSKTYDKHTTCLASGSLNYDPGDYEKMCYFADCPLVVHIYPMRSNLGVSSRHEPSSSSDSSNVAKENTDTMCCNIDILPIFLGDENNAKVCMKKRMEPILKPTALNSKSWDCLPLLTMEISVNRHAENAEHRKVLKNANWFQLTLIGGYNIIVPFCEDFTYTAVSKAPVYCEDNTALITYNQGIAVPKQFDPTCFYAKWESLMLSETFAKGNEKITFNLKDVQNEDDIDLQYYFKNKSQSNNIVWASFHRTLLLKKSSENWLLNQIRSFKWPLELHLFNEVNGYSFMALLNLSKLLYPGETKVLLTVPLEWINAAKMFQECDCTLLFSPNAPTTSPVGTEPKTSRYLMYHLMGVFYKRSLKILTETSMSGDGMASIPKTGGDENNAFIIVEVKLDRPLRETTIPKSIPQTQINKMLKEMEEAKHDERLCTGRGQSAKDWQSTVRTSAAALRRVPHYGTTDFYSFIRQLSETRTRVELVTSFWQEAAVYVNNNFVVKRYLYSADIFEELVMKAHVCLMKIARETLIGTEDNNETDRELKAARQARQMQDTEHAMELYMQLTVKRSNDGNIWRELSTCLKDMDKDWANVCLNKAVMMGPRHPLTLMSKGGMVFEENPAAAEMFFVALISYYPFWTTAMIVASAYYYDQQQYHVCDKILNIVLQSRRNHETEELGYARSWERELGDWWDVTPLLPCMNLYYDAADLLLRLRCVALAEVCVARVLTCSGESPAYYHLVALCCRLRGKYQDALCHLRIALDKFGEINYLRSLKAECLHQLGDTTAALESYEKSGCTGGPFTVIMALQAFKESQRVRPVLMDLVRQRPSAYAWMALADDWMEKAGLKEFKKGDSTKKSEQELTAVNTATACAEQALKCDRLAGPAWAFLATIVKPSARRQYCLKMASMCGYKLNKQCLETDIESRQSLCHRLGKPIKRCWCRQFLRKPTKIRH